MKTGIPLLLILFSFAQAFAQVPQGFSYQAVARGADGKVLADQEISLKIGILEGSPSGPLLYEETHTTTTSDLGLFSLKIGQGAVSSGSFEAIDWGNSLKYLDVALDTEGGNSYTHMGTIQLLSVPYALYAGKSGGDDDADPANELQDIILEGSELSITQGSTVDLGGLGAVTDSDDQTLSLTGTELSIEDGNTVDLSGLNTDGQTLSLENNLLSIEGGNAVDLTPLQEDGDADPANEIQDLQMDGDILTITLKEGATPVDLAPYKDNSDDQILSLVDTELSIEDGNAVDLAGLVDDADPDPENEIQDLQLNGHLLTLTINGAPTEIDLEPYLDNTDEQDLNLVDNSLNLTNDDTPVDLSGYLDNTDEQDLDDVLTRGADAGGKNILNLANPVNDMDAATKAYVDELESRMSAFEYSLLGSANGLALWNKLGNIDEVTNSATGPGGVIRGDLNFNHDVMYGKGVTPNGRGDVTGIDFPTTVVDPEKGTIELWAQFYEAPVAGDYGVYGFVNVAHWTHHVVAFYWHNSSSKLEMTLGFNGTVRGASLTGFSPAFNEPVHLAFVWDREGIDGSGDFMRVYVDGEAVATNTTENDWGDDNSSGNFRVAAPWDSNYGTDRYSLDNIKVWDHAKTSFEDRFMDGTITGSVEVASIDVSQITGLLGEGYTMFIPDIMDNYTVLEFHNFIGTGNAVITHGPGYDIEQVERYNEWGERDDIPGLSMEHPVIFEVDPSNQPFYDNLISWFNQATPTTSTFSIITRNNAGEEKFRWNGYDWIPDGYEPGIDGRTRFRVITGQLPDNIVHIQTEGLANYGTDASFNPETDADEVLFDGVQFYQPAYEIDTANHILTLTWDSNEASGVWELVRNTIQGSTYRPQIQMTHWLESGTLLRQNVFDYAFPVSVKYSGFGLDSKVKVQVRFWYVRLRIH